MRANIVEDFAAQVPYVALYSRHKSDWQRDQKSGVSLAPGIVGAAAVLSYSLHSLASTESLPFQCVLEHYPKIANLPTKASSCDSISSIPISLLF